MAARVEFNNTNGGIMGLLTISSSRGQLARWLRTSSAYDVLDDAVLGSLTTATVLDLFDDFGLTDNKANRAWFRGELNLALGEGC